MFTGQWLDAWLKLVHSSMYPVGADIVYPVGSLYVSSTFDEDSQSVAGGLFNVAGRVRTSQSSYGEIHLAAARHFNRYRSHLIDFYCCLAKIR